MKKIASIALAVALAPLAQAATLNTGDTTNGLSVGGVALASGTVKFGWVDPTFDFGANANDLAAIDAAFIEVFSYSGLLNGFGVDGIFEPGDQGISTTYNEAGTFEGRSYDLSADTTNVAGDIAGGQVTAWVLNDSANHLNSTHHAVFQSGQTWTDAQTIPINDTSFSWQDADGSGAPVALIGQIAAGVDVGAANPSHVLAPVPEPSRAVLGFLGLGALFFRRRR